MEDKIYLRSSYGITKTANLSIPCQNGDGIRFKKLWKKKSGSVFLWSRWDEILILNMIPHGVKYLWGDKDKEVILDMVRLSREGRVSVY